MHKFNAVCLIAIGTVASGLSAAEGLDNVLQRDLVTVTPTSFRHAQVNRCKLPLYGEVSEQAVIVSRRIEAPRSLMSRDQFVSLSTQLIVRNRAALMSSINPDKTVFEAYDALKCRRITEAVDGYDFEIKIELAATGITIETRDVKADRGGTDFIEWHELIAFDAPE